MLTLDCHRRPCCLSLTVLLTLFLRHFPHFHHPEVRSYCHQEFVRPRVLSVCHFPVRGPSCKYRCASESVLVAVLNPDVPFVYPRLLDRTQEVRGTVSAEQYHPGGPVDSGQQDFSVAGALSGTGGRTTSSSAFWCSGISGFSGTIFFVTFSFNKRRNLTNNCRLC